MNQVNLGFLSDLTKPVWSYHECLMCISWYLDDFLISWREATMEKGGEYRTSLAALIWKTNFTKFMSEISDVLYNTRYLNVGYQQDVYADLYGELVEIEAAA